MTYPIITLLATLALMLAMAMTLILKPKALRKFNGGAIFFAGLVGLIFYGLGYGTSIHSPIDLLVVSIRAVKDTITMFTGEDTYSSLVESAPWIEEHAWMQVIYWLAVLSAMYFTAAAVLGALGKRFLRFLRGLVIGWRDEIAVFYPTSDAQIALANDICKKNNINPVFIGECANSKQQEKIDNIGGIVWEADVVRADGNWLMKLGVLNEEDKVIRLFASGESDAKTKIFLQKVKQGMEFAGIPSKKLTMTVLCEDEMEFSFLTGKQKDGSYLQADICSYKNMAASMLTRTVAPWEYVTFNQKGEAENSFHAMILGFGQVGQSVLCELLRNSQFVGKKSKIQIVDKKYKEKAGAFLSIYKDMLDYYDVEFLEVDVFSEEFFHILDEEKESINYVTICMGDDESNLEIASQIRFFRNRKHGKYNRDMVIASCSKKEIIFYDSPDLTIPIPNPDNLWDETMDDDSKEIHKVYMKSKAEALYPGDKRKQAAFYKETWYGNDYSSRLSCSASAVFIPAMYKAAGIDETEKNPKKAMTKLLSENEELLVNLAEMEHLRWNAFTYSMGILPMEFSEFKKRVDRALEKISGDVELLEKGKLSLEDAGEAIRRIQGACRYVRKDLEPDGFGGLHVCLSEWNALDESWQIYYPLASAVAKAEHAYALIKWKAAGADGAEPELESLSDFKQLDMNNVMNLMEED